MLTPNSTSVPGFDKKDHSKMDCMCITTRKNYFWLIYKNNFWCRKTTDTYFVSNLNRRQKFCVMESKSRQVMVRGEDYDLVLRQEEARNNHCLTRRRNQLYSGSAFKTARRMNDKRGIGIQIPA